MHAPLLSKVSLLCARYEFENSCCDLAKTLSEVKTQNVTTMQHISTHMHDHINIARPGNVSNGFMHFWLHACT